MMFNITIPTLKQSPLRGYKEMPAHQEAIKIDRCVFKLDGNGKDSETQQSTQHDAMFYTVNS